ncbi:MAG: signal peptidase I [Clostridiales bacterium]|jgi:signal peptidase I|nr:signal peptidase I [Clostridiales bacterium]
MIRTRKMEPDSRPLPTIQQLETELRRVRYRRRFRNVFRSTVFTLITVAAIAVLVATLWLPVLKIYGSSMTPTLENGQIVISVKSGSYETGDLVVFRYNNKVLVKRLIAQAGDWVNIDKDGTVYVNDIPLDEPYLTEKALGECDLELPYQVPESRLFVMGDHRSVSVDSRSTAVGCVAEEQLVGIIVLRVWPLDQFGGVN